MGAKRRERRTQDRSAISRFITERRRYTRTRCRRITKQRRNSKAEGRGKRRCTIARKLKRFYRNDVRGPGFKLNSFAGTAHRRCERAAIIPSNPVNYVLHERRKRKIIELERAQSVDGQRYDRCAFTRFKLSSGLKTLNP